MADPRFYHNSGPFTLGELAKICQGIITNEHDCDKVIHDVAALSVATSDQISFLNNIRYLQSFSESQAGACVVHPEQAPSAPPTMALILTPTPYRAYGLIAAAFYPETILTPSIHPSAIISSSATIGEHCFIGPGCVIEEHVKIGMHSSIAAGTIIKTAVEIGEHCHIKENCVISHSIIGNNVTILPGAKIGQAGFGFFMDNQGYVNIPQLGRVIINDNVEIGSNTTIDRGAAGDTIIGKGTQIDNLVQIAHNVHIGKGCIIVAQVGIAGSTKIGDHTILAGQVGIAGHLSIGNNVKIAAQSGVMRNVEDNETVSGSPAVPSGQWHRQNIILKKLVTKNKE
jgi:UDP-3-O-[3-hydroxymyristoyl] glucosamine N-acyltransferase